MAAQFVKAGKYGQVEPNKLSGITFGNAVAQAPAYKEAAATNPIEELENGMFLKVIPDTKGVSPLGYIAVLPGAAPATAKPMMVFNEKKLYDERQGYSDFVAKASEEVTGVLTPRLIGMTPDADTFTTNTIEAAPGSLNVGDKLYVGNDGYLSKTAGTDTVLEFHVVKVYTLPDGAEAVKLISKIKA